MKTIFAIAIAAALTGSIQPASAGEQGAINQAGPYEANMKFYMHPAHLFWSSEAPHHNGEHPALLVKRSDGETAAPTPSMPRHPALERRGVLLAKAPAHD